MLDQARLGFRIVYNSFYVQAKKSLKKKKKKGGDPTINSKENSANRYPIFHTLQGQKLQQCASVQQHLNLKFSVSTKDDPKNTKKKNNTADWVLVACKYITNTSYQCAKNLIQTFLKKNVAPLSSKTTPQDQVQS